MSNKLKLKRITDLFTEGETCFLGDDEDAKPICIWVNKCNSLEEEEARMDAQSGRTQILLAMADPSHPETMTAQITLSEWSDDELFLSYANHKSEENITLALSDIEADETWTEKIDYIRRQPTLLKDAKVSDDDPRWTQLTKYTEDYTVEVERLMEVRNVKTLEDVKAMGREKAEEEFMKVFKDKVSIDHYVMEMRITRLYYSMRECEAVRDGDGGWVHTGCNHSNRLLGDRSEVRELPNHVLDRVHVTYEGLSVGGKNVANFPKPQSSSESSAQ